MNTLPSYAAQSKHASTFKTGDVILFPTQKATRRFKIVEYIGRHRNGSYLFKCLDESGLVVEQGFGSQTKWICEEQS